MASDDVETDPVKALMGASRDGLLTYHGSASGGQYEVDLAGERQVLPARAAVDVVARLRAIERVGRVAGGARLIRLQADDIHVVGVGDRVFELAQDRVIDWSEGFLAGYDGQGQDHTGDDQLEEIARLVEEPSRDDQSRMVILGLMYGRGEQHTVSTEALAKLIGELPDVERTPVKKTVGDALMFGAYLGPDLAEHMIRALGERWQVGIEGVACTGEPGKVLPQMPGVVVLRRIVEASRAGWLRYVDNPAPNEARWKKTKRDRWYRLTVGDQRYEIGADRVEAWLDGLAAFHTR